MQCSCAMFSSVACLALLRFSTLPYKWHDFWKMFLNKIRVLVLCTRWFKYDRDICGLFTHKSVPVIFEPPCKMPVWNISHSRKNLARYDQQCKLIFMYSTHHSRQILMETQFFRHFFWKSTQISNFTKIRQYKLICSMETGWRTDMTRLIVAFYNF